MPPAEQARSDLTALEYVNVEAPIERSRRNLKANRAGADNC